MNRLTMRILLSIGLGVLGTYPAAKADEWNQKTVVTFGEAVEIPGQTLPAGTYVFKLLNSTSSRHIVQVFNQDEKQVYGTFLAIPSHRHKPSEKTVIRFEERAAGSPQAIKAWFYPNKTYGHEFVYPKKEALELAEANHMPVPAVSSELLPVMTMHTITLQAPEIVAFTAAPLKLEEPNGGEVELAAAAPVSDDGAAALPAELPATGSSMPLVGLIGMLFLGAAAALRIRAVRVR